tara:strand:+ start:3822 stop:6587 length:2766 start_codon:yes stop_codon:yes gene_type:complete
MIKSNKHIQSHKFINKLTNDIELLERLISKNILEKKQRIGAEQEFCLVDDNLRPNPINDKIAEKLSDEGFVTEIAKFNMELNIDPIELNANSFNKLEKVLLDKMLIARSVSKNFNSELILTGILPTVRKFDLRYENITNNRRYFDLCDSISASRGKKYKIRISGIDELIFQHDSPLIEGCNTGFQFHLQIDHEIFHKMYNISQLIAGPVLSTCVNSPMLFGKRLWNETRIAVFQQATDTRIVGNYHLESLPRVTFGNQWLKKSLIEIYKEDITRYKILLKNLTQKNYSIENQNLPNLNALTLHNSTVYRWNRPCYGIYKNKPSIRIENRMLPSGPSIVDEVANSAFWLGLMMFYKENYSEDFEKQMKFDDARINFYSAAQQGIDATFRWFGKRVDARKLILNELIPKAAIGLSHVKINPEDINKYLKIIKDRTISRQNGARWIIDSYDSLNSKYSKQNTLTTITSHIIENQKSNIPIHNWNTPKNCVVINNPSNLLVEECMERDIYSINENDIFELAYQINSWNKKDFMVVVDDKKHISGILDKDIFNDKNYTSKKNKIVIKELMKKKLATIKPYKTIGYALRIMRQKKIEILPVVEDGLYIGIIQKQKLIQYEINENKFEKDVGDNHERIIGNIHSNNKKTIIFVSAIHGNEDSGVIALKKFFENVKKNATQIEGTVIGLIGNLKALSKNRRYIDEDLNRLWNKTIFKSKHNSEENELLVLKALIDKIITAKNKNDILIVDLHNTSSSNGVFTIVNNESEAKIANCLKVPTVNNLLNKIKGSFAEYYNKNGVNVIVFEGGAIGDPVSVNNHLAGIWKILEKRKFIKTKDIPQEVIDKVEKMKKFSEPSLGDYKLKYIHKISSNDDFLMNPNMFNFQKILKNEIIAHDKSGPICSPISGYLLMPLYQNKGNEGFYIIDKQN